jgi:Tfp pilus assembly protein FimT
MRKWDCSGWTLVEILVSLGLVSTLILLSLSGWQTLSDKLHVLRVRQQLVIDIHTARVLALEKQTPLTLSPLNSCVWKTSNTNDWSCGWRVLTTNNLNSTPLIQTSINKPIKINAFPHTPIQVNVYGDLTGVGIRWQFQAPTSPQTSWLICLNSTSRIRTSQGQTCS